MITIYELRDPSDADCKPRYIGITSKKIEYRLAEHINESIKSPKRYYKLNWIRSLLKRAIFPTIHGIEIAESLQEAYKLEKYWIKEFREQGYSLTNIREGGDGVEMTEEMKVKISLPQKGRPASPLKLARIRKASKLKKGKIIPHFSLQLKEVVYNNLEFLSIREAYNYGFPRGLIKGTYESFARMLRGERTNKTNFKYK